MDPNYIQTLHSLLQQTTSNDTALLKAATTRLNQEFYRNPACISGLASILVSDAELPIRQLAAIELRKRISQNSGHLWSLLPHDEREEIKVKLPQFVLVEQIIPVRNSAARVIAAIASIEVPQGNWNQLFPYLHQICTSDQVAHREVGSFVLFTVIEGIVSEQFETYVPALLDLFSRLVCDPESLEVRITTVRSLGVVAQYLNPKSGPIAAFQSLLPAMIQVISQCLDAHNDQGAKQLFDVLETFLILEVPVLGGHIPELVQFLLHCGSNRHLDEDFRILGLNALNWTVKYRKAKIQSLNLSGVILEGLMPIATEEEPLDEDEDAPSRSALRTIDALATNLPPTHVFPPLRTLIIQYFTSQDPSHRRGAILALGVSVEGCSEYMTPLMDDIWPIIEAGLCDADAGVRKATCVSVGCLCEWLEDSCASKHAVLFPNIMNLINDPATQNAACTALDALLEILEDVIHQYLQLIMERLVGLLESAPISVKSVVIGAIGSAAHAAKKDFLPYFHPTMNALSHFLTLTGEGEEAELRGITMDAIGSFSEAVGKDNFRQYFPDMMNYAFKGCEMGNARIRECSFLFFGVMASVFGEEFAPYVAQVVPLLVASCKQVEQGDDDTFEISYIDATSAFSSGSSPVNAISVADDDIDATVDVDELLGVNSGIAIEKEIAADTIGAIFISTKIHFLPYVENCTLALIPLLDHYYEGIRKSATESLFEIVRTFYDLSKHDEEWIAGVNSPTVLDSQVIHLINHTLPPLLQMYEGEDNKSVAASLFVGLGETINKIGPGFFQGHYETICKIALQILEQKALCQQDPDQDEDEEAPEDQAEYDSVLISTAGDLVAALANALGTDFTPAFDAFFPLIAKYYKRSRSLSDRSASIASLGEIISGMKGAITPYTEKLLELFYRSLTDSESEVLSNSAFAIGLLVENSNLDLSSQYFSILGGLQPLFMVPQGAPAARLNAKDNAAGAVARLILKNTAAIPFDHVLPAYIGALPLKNDYFENGPVFRSLFHLFDTNPSIMVPYVDQLLPVIANVLDPNEPNQVGDDIRSGLIQLIAVLNREFPEKIQTTNLAIFLPGV